MSHNQQTTEQKTMTKLEIFQNNCDNETGISLVVPRVFPTWADNDYPKNWPLWRKIKQFFIELGWAFIERVDVVPPGRIPKGRFKTAFIHCKPGSWRKNHQARAVLAKLSQGPDKFVTVTYNDPWFWKVKISSALKPDEPPRPRPKPEVVIDTEAESKTELTVDISAQERISTPDLLLKSPSSNELQYDTSFQPDDEMRCVALEAAIERGDVTTQRG